MIEMEALRINDYVGENGINIGINKLMQFKNKRVEIIILPAEEEKEVKSKSKFFSAVGKINIDENEINSLREMSKI